MQGQRALDQGHYDQAMVYFKTALERDIYDAEVIRDLGITLYFKDRPKIALGLLSLAGKKRPGDAAIYYYRGLIYQQLGKGDEAIRQYRFYDRLALWHPLRKEMENRFNYLVRQKIKIETKRMLQTEQALGVSHMVPRSVAVMYFSGTSQNETFTPLQKGLADMVITDLSQIKSLIIVERARMDLLMQELGLGMSGLLEPSTATRMGRLLGAEKVVSGTLVGLDAGLLRVDMGIIDARTRSAVARGKIAGPLKRFYQLEKDIVFKLIDLLGIKPTGAERHAIEKVPTKDLLAFMAYCRGLDYEDRGDWQKAQQEFAKAHLRDPGFAPARQKAQKNAAFEQIAADTAPPVKTSFSAGRAFEHVRPGAQHLSVTMNKYRNGFDQKGMLLRTGHNVGRGFIPGPDSRKPVAESTASTFGNSTTISINIPVPVKP